MVHIRLCGDLFEIDLASPGTPARWWFVGGWANHTLTNEEALFDPAARPSSEEVVGEVPVLTGSSTGVPIRRGMVPSGSGANDP